MSSDFSKSLIANRYWMLGRGMHMAINALSFAEHFHGGTRKDGKTPEFSHQIAICSYLRTLEHHLDQPEITLAVSLLHDVCEDYDVGFVEIAAKFGSDVDRAVQLLTKKHRGKKLDAATYYGGLAENNVASVVKGADRIHNIQSMVGVFSLEKQKLYMEETRDHVIPMLKLARKQFSTQDSVYENEKLILHSQLDLYQAMHQATAKAS